MIRKYREGIKRTLCFFLTAGVFLGGFFHPAFAGEVPEKETEKLAVFSEEEIEWIAEICDRRASVTGDKDSGNKSPGNRMCGSNQP